MDSIHTFLRPAHEDDCADIYEVHRYAVRYTCSEVYDERTMNAWLALLGGDSYLDSIRRADKALWVVEFHQRIRGFFQVDFQEAQLDALYVHPFFHRQGLGTAMLQRAEKLALQENLSVLSLFASHNSVPFYRLNGYDSLGDSVVPLNRVQKIPCQLMRKFLTRVLISA